MAWIELHDTLGSHRKTYALADALDIPQYSAVGLLCLLWTWALNNAQDGDLSKFPPHAIARACFWQKKPESLADALIKCGWMDDDKRLHDWVEYAGRFIDKREDTRQRVAAYRNRKKEGCNALRNADVTRAVTHDVTQCNASTINNSTVHNSTVPKEEEDARATPLLSEQDMDTYGQLYRDNISAIEDQAVSMGMGFHETDRRTAERFMADYSAEWVIEAMRRTALQAKDKRSWSYIEGILKKWLTKGGIDSGPGARRTSGGGLRGDDPPESPGGVPGGLTNIKYC